MMIDIEDVSPAHLGEINSFSNLTDENSGVLVATTRDARKF
jgi:hypothetical protein